MPLTDSGSSIVRGAAPMSARPAAREQPWFVLVLLGALYFAQGLPLGLIFGAYPVLLRSAGAELSLVAWVPLLGLPWMFKFLWGPFVDNHWVPALGRRRTWLLTQQALTIVMVGLLTQTMQFNGNGAVLSLVLLGLASCAAATQDVATDGLAAERLMGRDLALANAFSVGGIAAGTLVGGGGVLMLVETAGLSNTLLAVAALLSLCAVPALLWRETSVPRTEGERASLRAVARRPHFLFVLALAGLYAASHAADGALSRLFLVDKGWTPSDIGMIDSAGLVAMIVLGCGGAAWLVARAGVWAALIASVVLLVAASIGWLGLCVAANPPGFTAAVLLRVVGGAGMGLASVAVYTVLMLFARGGKQAATDVTAFKSANVLGEIAPASLATALAGHAGYALAFGISVVASLLVLLIVLLRPAGRALELDGLDNPEEVA